MSNLKILSINDLVEEGKGPIWVINNSNEHYPSGADVFVTINNNGQSSVLPIARTWLPVELTAKFPRKIILESPYFMEALSKGLLKAIPVETAMKMLREEDAPAEQKRLAMIDEAIREANQTRGIGKNVTVSTGDIERDEEMAAIGAEQQRERNRFPQSAATQAAQAKAPRGSVTLGNDFDEDTPEVDEVSPAFKAWVEKVNLMEDSVAARGEVKMRGQMEIDEAIYLVKKCVHSNVTQSLAKKLAKLNVATA